MAMIMDINGSDPLQAGNSANKFFSPEALSYHGCKAGTSMNLHRSSNEIYDDGYTDGISPSPSVAIVCSGSSESTSGDDTECCSRSIADGSAYVRSHSAPGPTSCMYLEMALKRLYAREDFDILESLGEGFFGDVYKVRHQVTGEVMVLKVGKERERENRTRVKASVLKEVDVLNQLTSHPNLLAFRGVCVDSAEKSWNLHILMDFCDTGSLSRLICDHQRCFPWSLRCTLARDISYAMDYVHSKNIMHRDLTSMNVLLQTVANGSLKAVVADFGLSCKIPQPNEKLIQVGTPYWMAPECLKEEFYDEKADVFSFGIILCQMIARIDADPEAGLYRTHNFGLDHVQFTAHCPTDTPLAVLNVALKCCLMEPAARPSFRTVYEFFIDFLILQQINFNETALLFTENDGRLGRSLSDATLKSSKSKQSDLFPLTAVENEQSICRSDCKVIRAAPLLILQEGVPYDDLGYTSRDEVQMKKSRMEELARSVAVDEPSDEDSLKTGNPFMMHEIYKTTRKLAFPELENRRKRVTSDVKDTGDGSTSSINFSTQFMGSCGCHDTSVGSRDGKQALKANIRPKKNSKNIIRRSISLPSTSVNYCEPSRSEECATFDPLLPSSSSAGLSFVQRDKVVIGDQCALKGQMSMAYKNEDQKFTSRRYPARPSRRYTRLNGRDLVGERLSNDFLLKVNEAALSRDIDGLTFAHWKSFSSSLQRASNVVVQQPFPVRKAADRCLEETSGNLSTSQPPKNASNGSSVSLKNSRENVDKVDHVQVKRDTVVLATDKKSSVDDVNPLDPFCVAGRKCRSSVCRRQIVAQIGDTVREYVPQNENCILL